MMEKDIGVWNPLRRICSSWHFDFSMTEMKVRFAKSHMAQKRTVPYGREL